MAARIHVLRHKRDDAKRQARAILDAAADDGNRELTDDEKKSFDKLEASIGELEDQVLEEEALIERDRNVSPRDASLTGRGRTYAQLFPAAAAGSGLGGFRSRDAFWSAILLQSSQMSPELFALQQSDVDSAGGVGVPTEVERRMLDAALETSIVMSRADIVPMRSEKKRVWAFDGSSTQSGTLYGGAVAQWKGEGQAFDIKTLETRKIELVARKLGMLVEETTEIMESGPGFSGELETKIGEALGWFLDDAFMFGDGVGKPQGALTAANPARILVTRGGGNLISGTDVVNMVERLHPAMADGAIWITSNTTLDQLAKAHIAGTNSDSFLYAPSRGEGVPSTLMGFPVRISEKSPNLGTEGDLALVNFRGYAVGLRQGMRLDQSMHVGFARDVITLRALWRGDGQSKWLKAFQPKDSNAATLSYAVVLAA